MATPEEILAEMRTQTRLLREIAATLRLNVEEWQTEDAEHLSSFGNESGGIAIARIGPAPQGYRWLVHHTAVKAAGGGNCELFITERDSGTPPDIDLVDFTSAGAEDVADYPHPLIIPSGHYLVARWALLTAGTQGVLTAQIAAQRRLGEVARG